MNAYYPKYFTDSLGLDNLCIGFYYVLTPNKEGLIECWTPTSKSCTYYKGDLSLEDICSSLNNKTKEIYKSLEPQEGESKIDVIKRVMRDFSLGLRDGNELVKEYTDLPTYTLIKGGPLDNKCVVKGSILPINVLDIYSLPLEETITFDDEDEWCIGTFSSEPPNNFFLTSIVKYPSLQGKDPLSPSNKVLYAHRTSDYNYHDEVTEGNTETSNKGIAYKQINYNVNEIERYTLLYKGSLKTCIELEPILERVYKEGQNSIAAIIAKYIKANI